MATRIFISHAAEDKEQVARPLAELLRRNGFDVWYDEYSLELGDILRREIDTGLKQCDFGVVILSPRFFAKEWPKRELDGLLGREVDGRKVILPIWHEVDRDQVAQFSPMLAERLAASTSLPSDLLVQRIESATQRKQTARDSVLKSPSSNRGTDLRFFVVIRLSGAQIVEAFISSFCGQTGIRKSEIQSADFLLFDDFSGLDPFESFILFKSNARWMVETDIVLEVAASLAPEIAPSYVPMGWSISDETFQDTESRRMADHLIDVTFAKEPSSLEKNAETTLSYLRALLTLSSESSPDDELWWSTYSLGRRLTRQALELDHPADVREMIGVDTDYKRRGDFLFGRALVLELNRAVHYPIWQQVVDRLMSTTSALNDHWRGTLKEKWASESKEERPARDNEDEA